MPLVELYQQSLSWSIVAKNGNKEMDAENAKSRDSFFIFTFEFGFMLDHICVCCFRVYWRTVMLTLKAPSCDAGVSAWEALGLNSIIACVSVPSLPNRKCTVGEWRSCLVLHVCFTHVGCMHPVHRKTGMPSVVSAAI